MKKVLSLIMAGVLSVGMLTACGGKEETPSYDVNEVLNTITTAVPIAMVSADRVVVIEAAEGKIDAVTEALETFKQSAIAQFELYLPDQYEKAKAGRVVVKGNYAVLVIAGDNEVIANQGVEEAYKAVDAAIDEAFK